MIFLPVGANPIHSEVDVENNLFIKLDTPIELVDLLIDYNIECYGLTDEGIITLTIFLNDENVSFNIVQSPTIRNGTLKIENIEVERGDALTFRIDAIYASIIPLYSNSTSAMGVGVFIKSKLAPEKIFVFGFSVDVKILQLESGEDYVDLEVLTKLFYIFENGLFQEPLKILSGTYVKLYSAKSIFSTSFPFCMGLCNDWGIIG